MENNFNDEELELESNDYIDRRKIDKKTIVLSLVGIIVMVVVVIGASAAAFYYSRSGNNINRVKTGHIILKYNEVNQISITEAVPLDDIKGKMLTNTAENTNNTFVFSVKADVKGKTSFSYELTADKDTDGDKSVMKEQEACSGTNGAWSSTPSDANIKACTLIPDNLIRLYLVSKPSESANSAANSDGTYDASSNITPLFGPSAFVTGTNNTKWGPSQYGAPSDEMVIYREAVDTSSSGSLDQTKWFELRMWVNEAYEIDGVERSYAVRVNLYAKDKASS